MKIELFSKIIPDIYENYLRDLEYLKNSENILKLR